MDYKKLIKLLETKCKSSKGFMGVNYDSVKTSEELFENVKDEITSITEVMNYSDIEEEFGMSDREAKGYIKKLENFLVKFEKVVKS